MWKKCCCCFYPREYEPPDVLELDYRHNSLDEVPPEIFTHERTLEKLLLGSNQIKDLPPNLFHCHELRELDLNDNEVKEIPSAIESLTRLAKLNIGRNCIGDVPESIKNCKNLTYLDLSINTLTKIPEVICQLVHLEELFLNETSLEFLPANFGRLTKLRTLELRENLLQTLPKSMSRLHQLQKLDIGSNDIEELPEVIGTMTNLTELWVDNNCIREVPKFIGNLTKLTCLDFSNNDLHEISSDIGKCINLSDLAFAHNSLTSLPDAFTRLENVVVVRLNNNSLACLPEEVGKMKNLQELNVISNCLRSIPPSIGLLRKLHTLYIDDNRLNELPKEIGSCTSLTVFSAVRNCLKEIPSEIGHLGNLRMLALTNNSIRNLPVSILGLTNLGALWLTEGQNKPLVTLNREICAETGQHVVTCCLLPQPPPPVVEPASTNANENGEELPPRSARKIRFEDIVESEPPSPEVAKPAINGGLSRAPTPYPKELRALSKSASQIRQKGQNGDATNVSAEPVYEGDLVEEPKDHNTKTQFEMKALDPTFSLRTGNKDRLKDKFVSNKKDAMKHSYSLTETHVDNKADLLRATTSEANVSMNTVGLPMGSGTVQTSRIDDLSAPPVPTLSIGKTPPPYEIAAKRAAFFRSSGGAGTGRVFPESLHGGSSSNTNATMLTNQHTVPDISATSMSYPLSENLDRINMNMNQGVVALLQEPTILQNDPYQHERRTAEPTDNAAFSETQTVQYGKQDDSQNEFHYSEVLSDKNANITSKPKYALEDATNGHMQEPLLVHNQTAEDNANFNFSSSSPIKLVEESNALHQSSMSAASNKVSMSRIPMSHSSKRAVEQCITPPAEPDDFRLSKIPSAGRGKRMYSAPLVSNILPPAASPAASEPQHSPSPLASRAKIPVRKPALPMQYDSGKVIPPAGSKSYAASTSRILNFSAPPEEKDDGKKKTVQSTSNIKYGNANYAPKSGSEMNSGIGLGGSGVVSLTDPGHDPSRKGGSRIPRFGSGKGAPEDSRYPLVDNSATYSSVNASSEKPLSRGVSPRQSRSGIPKPPSNSSVGAYDPKGPAARKPWIFGSHRNARVVSVEYRKINLNHLGFTIDDFASQAPPEGKGIYVTATDFEELPIKIGDKILQVDGIDVDADNMGVEIVNKILSNCRENIQLLVSRHQ